MRFVKPEIVPLKTHPTLNEAAYYPLPGSAEGMKPHSGPNAVMRAPPR